MILELIPVSSVYAMNGKTIEVDNTDAEGRLVLAGMSSIQIGILIVISEAPYRRIVLWLVDFQSTHHH